MTRSGNFYPADAWVEHLPAHLPGVIDPATKGCSRCGEQLELLWPFAEGTVAYVRGTVATGIRPDDALIVPCFPAIPEHRRIPE